MKFRFIEFNEDINKIVSRENHSGNNLFICPNHKSLSALQSEFQNYTAFKQIEFLTMDQFKNLFLTTDLPPLKEEKRTLAFYASLSVEHKEHFHINDYFQSISLAHQFFTFFEELAEENIEYSDIDNQIENKITDAQWQELTFKILLEIRSDYLSYIEKRGFSDSIFGKVISDPLLIEKYDNIIVVNQFYLTGREKFLLPENTILYLQIPKSLYDTAKCKCSQQFSAEYLKNIRTNSINLRVFNDEFSLKHFLFSMNNNHKTDLFIDTGMLKDHLDDYSPIYKTSYHFNSSSVFKFFDNLYHLLSGIVFQNNVLLIEINSIIKVVNDQNFLSYFADDNFSEEDNCITWEYLYKWIYSLTENSCKYIDFSLKLIDSQPPPNVKILLENLLSHIKSYESVSDINGFINILENCQLSKIITEDECHCSDLPEVYYQMIYDFKAIDSIGIIDNWLDVFPQNSSSFATGTAILKLFLNYAKNKDYKFLIDNNDSVIPEITSLNNTRNLTCEHAVIIDAIEGNLPPSRKTPFFLTESQRAALNLKTYSDIVLREKYYFLRLIAQSKEVTILSRAQEKNNIEISSFVEELKLYHSSLFTQSSDIPLNSLQNHINFWLAPQFPETPIPSVSENFDKLPFSKECDLRNNIFPLSPSSINLLIEQPFLYYINNILKLNPRELHIEMDYSAKQLGNIIHSAFSAVWLRIIDVYEGNLVHHDFRYNQQNYAERALDNYLMNTDDLILKIPYNHSQLYFEKIVKRFISESIETFLHECSKKYNNIQIKIIPEKDGSLQKSRLFKINDIDIVTYGIADLRIELLPTHEFHIYDYKSAKFNKYNMKNYAAQLGMYEKLYYNDNDNVMKFIYFVIDRDVKKISDFADELMDDIRNSVIQIIKHGYGLGDKKFTYEDEEFTRRQLIRQFLNNSNRSEL